eukprot:CAMPEP_0119374788 /NCGR_PEP_ID=MMETSP1334-20130426/32903_1 /TAXON_ID=127549 /ORGANISM="Calcidiscus leptoporus, Strain RCC1130" /LENGTH=47 /DNA_ID= /DNA_START= /DNA_END= /DNA_ORIENTATION=
MAPAYGPIRLRAYKTTHKPTPFVIVLGVKPGGPPPKDVLLDARKRVI